MNGDLLHNIVLFLCGSFSPYNLRPDFCIIQEILWSFFHGFLTLFTPRWVEPRKPQAVRDQKLSVFISVFLCFSVHSFICLLSMSICLFAHLFISHIVGIVSKETAAASVGN